VKETLKQNEKAPSPQLIAGGASIITSE